ncbi:Pyridine nucleotide-disulfide oxidoreductase OS=Streptomyces antimycoticus OX=68175 GN=hcaD_1 PE=4 SV=1 [Streptomyces antimycoticus]
MTSRTSRTTARRCPSRSCSAGCRPTDTALPRRRAIEAQWRLGVAATGLDPTAKRVALADGTSVEYDRLLIATGVRSRPWPNELEAGLDGVFVLRTMDDAHPVEAPAEAGPSRVLVIGAGFTGSEIASVCRERDLPVTVAERGPTPLSGALGNVIGDVAAQLHHQHGVDLRCGVMVTGLEGDGAGRLRRAHFSDGGTVDAEVAVVSLGATRNTEWLAGSGLAAGPRGIACDAGCRAFDVRGIVADDVFVAGDVARSPHPLFGYQFLSLEHWGNAVAQAEVAAHNMICPGDDSAARTCGRRISGRPSSASTSSPSGSRHMADADHRQPRARWAEHRFIGGLWVPRARHRRRHLRPGEMAGVLPAADRTRPRPSPRRSPPSTGGPKACVRCRPDSPTPRCPPTARRSP